MGATLSPCIAHDNSIVVNRVSWSQGGELIADTALEEVIPLYSSLFFSGSFLSFPV